MAANVKFFIFAHGNVVYNKEGPSYDREPLKKIRVKTDASYMDLLNAICTKIGSDPSAHQIRVLHRHPTKSVGDQQVRYNLVPIDDDSDVEDLIEMAEKLGEESIQQLYIEISNRSIGLSEHETRQVDKGPRYDIDSSNDINNTKQEIKRASEDSPTETGENLVVADLRNEDPSQNLMIYKLHDPTALPMPPSPVLMDITSGMEEGNQTSRPSSSTTPPRGQDYEVFISFRGIDTRYGFTDHLYNGLVNAGVLVFRDNEELRVGKEIGPELLKAIEGSKISVPIISKNYASSAWCLNELVQILKCKNTSGQIVLPIFYQVEPSEVRNQKGDFGKGFLLSKGKHDAEGRLDQDWKNALVEVASLKAWESSKIANGYEGELIKMVVHKVLQVLRKVSLLVSDYLVGVEDHVKKIIERIAAAKGSSDVHAIVIHGMGGIGKTTLAKVVYNRLCKHFERCSFIANIREASQSFKGMESLQMQLILQILGRKLDVLSIDEGANIIKTRCNRKKALILLDDMEQTDQLNALAGKPDWFGGGTLIIITSRRKDILKKWEGRRYSYELNGLDPNQSFILFCKHAFKSSDSIPDEYKTISMENVLTTGGLPLAIEIIGSLLYGNGKDIWEANLKMLKEIPHDDVKHKLKISFDALNQDEKEIFLDISCLPIRTESELEFAFYMWEGCGFQPRVRIEKLISLSLIKIGDDEGLIIHDQLRDLGREIVRQEDIHNLGKRSRLWKEEEANEVLESKQGTPNVQALCFGDFSDKDDHYTSQQFEGMKLLRFLHMQRVQLTGNFENLFLNLRWLWGECIDIFGINFKPKRLVVLQLDNCNVTECWTGWNEMKHLKVLELRGCHELNTTPDFSAMEELDVLVLSECRNLREIDSSIGKFSKSLRVLDVSDCRELKELPKEVGKMEELRTLDISWTSVREIPIFEGYLTKLETLSAEECGMLSELPKSIGKLELLTKLDLSSTGVTQLPDSFDDLYNLEKLSMSNSKIECLPTSIGNLHKLQKLDLCDCSKLREIPESIGKLKLLTELGLSSTGVKQLPDSFGDLYNLEKLSMSNSKIECLPTSIGNLHKLQKLDLCDCSELREIPESIGKLKFLIELGLSSTGVKQLPDSFGDLYNLEKLSMSNSKIECLPTSIGNLHKLQKLDLCDCSELREIPESIGKLKFLIELGLSSTGVKQLPDSFGDLYNLEKLSMSNSKIECLPTSIGNLHKLQKLDLCDCSELREIPESIGKLKFLIELGLSSTGVKQLPDSFGDLYNLEKLSMSNSKIKCLPTSIGNLHKLQKLDLWYCRELREIPESIGKLKLLTELGLSSTGVKQLPDSFGDLYNLEKLSMSDSKIKCLPTSIGNLHKLQKLDLCYCSELREIPESIGKLKFLIELGLSGTHVKQLPDSIGDLYNLEKLSMFNSKIECLLTSIGNLHKLAKLDLRYYRELREIPESIGKLKLLTELDLSHTRVTELPHSIGDLRDLKRLSISHSYIKILPTSIGKLNKLQELDLEGCKELECLPNLPCSLAFVSFNGDSMETLPDFSDLTNMNHLIYKDLFQRRSRELNLGKLNQLKELNIHDSKLQIQEGYHCSNINVYGSTEEIDMAPENFCLLLELPLSVEQLEVIGCQTLYTLPNLSTLKNLSRLHLQKCSKLLEINGLEGAESLVKVHISACHPEIKIPDLSMLRNLKDLTINRNTY